MITPSTLTTSPKHFSLKGWENVRFELMGVQGLKALAKRYSQLKPTWAELPKSKLPSAGGQTVLPSQASLQETIQLSEYDRVAT